MFTVVRIIGAICQQNVAAIGYVGILTITFLMMRYSFRKISPNYEKRLKKQKGVCVVIRPPLF